MTDYKSHEIQLFSNDNNNILSLKDTSMAEPGNEMNTVNKFFRLELKGLDGTTNSRMVVVPQLAVYNKYNQYVLPVGWTIGELQEAIVRIDGDLVAKNQQLASLEADYTDQIEQEQASRLAADGVHTVAIANEVNAREQADVTLDLKINQEIADRKAAVSSLNTYSATNAAAVTAEHDRAVAVEETLAAADATEAKARSDADVVLGGRVDTEVADRKTAVADVVASVSLEGKRAFDAEQALSDRIDFITHNVDAAALDSLSEIVSKFNADGSTYASRLSAIEATLALLLNQ